jgi:hypothetical protein
MSRNELIALCPTCGKPSADGRDCAVCERWWADNPPPRYTARRAASLRAKAGGTQDAV